MSGTSRPLPRSSPRPGSRSSRPVGQAAPSPLAGRRSGGRCRSGPDRRRAGLSGAGRTDRSSDGRLGQLLTKCHVPVLRFQSPADKLIPREEVGVVRYLVARGDWQRAACPVPKIAASTRRKSRIVDQTTSAGVLCRAYVRAIAAQAGLICSEPEEDYGIDLCLRAIRRRGPRLADVGGQLDLQLKSTTRPGERFGGSF